MSFAIQPPKMDPYDQFLVALKKKDVPKCVGYIQSCIKAADRQDSTQLRLSAISAICLCVEEMSVKNPEEISKTLEGLVVKVLTAAQKSVLAKQTVKAALEDSFETLNKYLEKNEAVSKFLKSSVGG